MPKDTVMVHWPPYKTILELNNFTYHTVCFMCTRTLSALCTCSLHTLSARVLVAVAHTCRLQSLFSLRILLNIGFRCWLRNRDYCTRAWPAGIYMHTYIDAFVDLEGYLDVPLCNVMSVQHMTNLLGQITAGHMHASRQADHTYRALSISCTWRWYKSGIACGQMLALMCTDKVSPYDDWYRMRLTNISMGGTLVVFTFATVTLPIPSSCWILFSKLLATFIYSCDMAYTYK